MTHRSKQVLTMLEMRAMVLAYIIGSVPSVYLSIACLMCMYWTSCLEGGPVYVATLLIPFVMICKPASHGESMFSYLQDTRSVVLDFGNSMSICLEEEHEIVEDDVRIFHDMDEEFELNIVWSGQKGCSIIDQLPTSFVCGRRKSGRNCSICLEPFVVGEVEKSIPCFHTFHANCIDQWLKKSVHCPICKSTVE